MKKTVLFLLVFVLFSSLMFAAPKIGGNLIVAIETEPVGLDPNLVTAFASHRILENIYDGLLRYDENMALVPNLAEKFELVDPQTIVFTLRNNVKFHDGTPMTIEDVLFTFDRIRSEETGSPAASYYSQVESVKALDDKHVEFKLSVPMASSILPNFAGVNSSIISKKFIESGANMQLQTNGTGPFALEEYIAGDHITLVKNSNYFVPKLPYLDTVKFVIIPEEVSRVSALRNGDVDLSKIGEPLSLNMLGKDFEIFRKPVFSYYLIGINTTRGPLSDPKVRNALNYAINREALIQMVAFGEGTKTGPLNPTIEWGMSPDEFPEFTYNPVKAKELLTEAGYPDGFEFEIVTAQRYNFDKIAQVIQAQVAQAGVKANINIVEWGIFIKKWRESDFDSFVSLNSGSVEPDIQFNRTFHTGGSTNVFMYSNARVDELLDNGRITVEKADRKNIYDELQKILVEESPIIFLYSPNVLFASQKTVKDFRVLSNESLIFLRETWLDD